MTRDRLQNITQTFINKRLRSDHSIICIYLVGSMLKEDPFINGSADVDLVVVHDIPVENSREIISVSPDVTIDIHHIDQTYYTPPRKVRKDPWIGSSLCFDPVVLYGKGHWFEFARASIEAGFFNPEYVMGRSKLFLSKARTNFSELERAALSGNGNYPLIYLKTIENTVNALACLVQAPLTDRTLMRQFKDVADALKQPETVADLHALILGQNDPSPYYEYFYNSWNYYMDYFGSSGSAEPHHKMNTARLAYYTAPVAYYWTEHLTSALWIMAKSWSSIANYLYLEDNEYYNSFCSILEISKDHFPQRRSGLEHFIEQAEESQFDWGKSQGYLESDAEGL